MQQAEEAKQKEAQRQARLKQGSEAINSIFEGGGFDDAFYQDYENKYLNYSLPQVKDQYQRARDKLTADLSRAGLLRSTAAVDATSQLFKENEVNTAAMKAAGDQQAAQLRNQIANQKQSAMSQLYATEDPTVAANTATSSVQQGQIATPNLNPLGALFTPIAVGGISGLNQFVDNYNTSRGLQANPPGVDRGRYTA